MLARETDPDVVMEQIDKHWKNRKRITYPTKIIREKISTRPIMIHKKTKSPLIKEVTLDITKIINLN